MRLAFLYPLQKVSHHRDIMALALLEIWERLMEAWGRESSAVIPVRKYQYWRLSCCYDIILFWGPRGDLHKLKIIETNALTIHREICFTFYFSIVKLITMMPKNKKFK